MNKEYFAITFISSGIPECIHVVTSQYEACEYVRSFFRVDLPCNIRDSLHMFLEYGGDEAICRADNWTFAIHRFELSK